MRCFMEIDIPEGIKAALLDAVKRIRKENPESSRLIGITKGENLHITILFLGEISEAQIGGIIKTASDVAKKFAEFVCTISKIEAVPKKYPRMIWASLDENKALSGLYNELSRAILPKSKKENDFAAHITLIRIKNDAGIETRQKIAKSIENVMKIPKHICGFSSIPKSRSVPSMELQHLKVNITPMKIPVRELKLMQSVLKKEGSEYTLIKAIKLRELA